MEIIKRIQCWWKRNWGHKYINGGQGVISIFLACLMLPFLTFADYMVETARYHEAVQILNDSLDSGNLSVLANYDQYMFDRFGILAVSQTQKAQVYDTYIKSNLSGVGAWTGVTATAQLQHPLSDADILKRHVLEASKFASPFALANDMAVSQLISKLEGLNESLSDMTKLLDAYAKYTDATVSMIKGVDKLNKCQHQLHTLEKTYHEKYDDFKTAVQALCEYEPPADEEGASDDSLIQLEATYDQAKSEYISAITKFREKMKEYQQCVADVLDNMSALVKNARGVYESDGTFKNAVANAADAMNTDIQELDQKIASAAEDKRGELLKQKKTLQEQRDSLKANDKTIVSTTKAAVDSLQESFNDNLKFYDKTACSDVVSRLDTCKKNVESLSVSLLESNYEYKENEFYLGNWNICVSVGISVIEKLVDGKFEEIISLIKAASAAIQNLFTTNIIYDGSLNTVVSADMLELDRESGWLDVMYALQKLSDDLNGFEQHTGGILSVLVRIKNIILDAMHMVQAIVKVISGMVVRAIESVAEIKQGKAGEKILISEYITKSMANRTNYASGSDLFTGYKFSKVKFIEEQEIASYKTDQNNNLSGMIKVLKSMSESGEHKIFCGAELEYILIGSSSEIANQSAVFLQIYFMRLLLDVVPIIMDREVQAMATACGAASLGIGTVVVYIVELFVQPLIETISITNGSDIDLWNTVIYLTPSGVVCALGRFTKFKLTDGQAKQLKTSFAKVSDISNQINMKSLLKNKAKDDGGYKWDYDNYCFVLLMLTGESTTAMHRLANIMNMEAAAYYGDKKFDIRESYTSVTGTASGNYQIILPFDHLSDTGFGNVKKSRARSY